MTAQSRIPTRFGRAAVVVGTGLAVALVPLASLAGPAHATATPAPTGCATGALPDAVKGKPAGFKGGLPAGAWVWHDSKGFHLRVTHDNKSKLVFTGVVRSSHNVFAQRFALEKNDELWRKSDHSAVKFTLRNYGAVDGIDFQTGCAKRVTISLSVGGTKLAVTQIHIGTGNTNPTANPFAIIRTVPAPPAPGLAA